MYAFARAREAPLTHRRQLPLTGQRLFSRLSHPLNVFSFWCFRPAARHFQVCFFHLVKGGPSRCNGLRSRGRVAFSQFGCQAAKAGCFSRGSPQGRSSSPNCHRRLAVSLQVETGKTAFFRRTNQRSVFFLQETPISLFSTDIFGRISGILERPAVMLLRYRLFDFPLR